MSAPGIPEALLWPLDGRGPVEALAQRVGLSAGGAQDSFEVHPVRCAYAEVPALARGAGPALLYHQIPGGAPSALLVLGPADLLGRVRLLGRDGQVRRLPVDRLVQALRAGPEALHGGSIEALLDAAGLSGRSRSRVRARLMEDRLRGLALGGGALLRASPRATLLAQAREARALSPLFLGLLTRALGAALGVGAWGLIGAGALSGRLAPGWVVGWSLVMLTALWMDRLSALHQGRLALRIGVRLKQVLLQGVMRSDPETFRRDGVGGALARVQEAQAIEDLMLTGGLGALLATLDLGVAAWVLAQAANGLPLLLVLGLVITLTLLAGLRLRGLLGLWTAQRRGLTHLLVERMVGHRSRLAQAEPGFWNAGEDEALARYHQASLALDRHRVALGGLLGGAWMLPGLAVVGLGFALSPAQGAGLALALGGLMLAQGALTGISGSVEGLVTAAVAAQEVLPLLRQARDLPAPGDAAVVAAPMAPGQALLRARGLGFSWPSGRTVLRGVDLELRLGDRVLVTGPSGGGKSTLVSLLAGLRSPSEGLLLLGGLDHQTLGQQRWRQRAVAAPQFHDNHIFESSLAFNLLMGKEWPASPQEQDEARALCEELGLGELLSRMPGGLGQLVGASGWQLSHGERSRVFLARALLQGAELVLLDESFAALDPETLALCLAVAERRAPALLVIAHP